MQRIVHRLLDVIYPGLWEIRIHLHVPLERLPSLVNESPVLALRGESGTYLADPMVFQFEGRQALFYEKFLARSGKGVLLAQELSSTFDPLGPPRLVLSEPWHLSFPFVFKLNGVQYLIPESYQRRAVLAYPCLEFPFRWGEPLEVMADCDLVDSTFYEQDDGVFMLTSPRGGGGADDRGAIVVFHTHTALFPQGPWQPVAVVGSVLGRNAGPLFWRDGRLFRPTQNSQDSYGRAVVVAEVVRLETSGYREIARFELTPDDADASHLHTLHVTDDCTAIDIRQRGLTRAIGWNWIRILTLLSRLRRSLEPSQF